MGIALDLTKRAFVRTRRNLTAIGSWVRYDDGWQPCIVLVRSGEEMAEDTVPCIIPLNRAWIWSSIGQNGEWAQTVAMFLNALRLPLDQSHVNLLGGFVEDLLGDLAHIPPVPPTDGQPGQVMAELTVVNHTTGETRETELRADV